MRNAARFDANIVVGTVPDTEDLDQLQQLGYRTLVDVREEEEKFGGLVEMRATARGLRYIGIPIPRSEVQIQHITRFYQTVYDPTHIPVYAFSRFGKKPAAFLVLLEAIARGEPLASVSRRASRLGFDIRGDLCLQSFLVDVFNGGGHRDQIVELIQKLRPDLAALAAERPSQRAARHSEARKATNITWQEGLLSRERRWRLLGHRGATVWLTGLSASGKSTIASALEEALVEMKRPAYRLDGDNIRHGLNSNLAFTADDRHENIRRIGEVAKLFTDSGTVAITAFISPYREDRDQVRKAHEDAGLPFLEVFADAPLELCEQRDPKGLYRKARAGQLPGFTGIDDPYEPPLNAELVLQTAELSVDACVERCLSLLELRVFGDARVPGCGLRVQGDAREQCSSCPRATWVSSSEV